MAPFAAKQKRRFTTRVFCIFCFVFSSFDAAAEQRLDGFSPNFYQMFFRCNLLMVVSHENWSPQKLGLCGTLRWLSIRFLLHVKFTVSYRIFLIES